MAQLHSYIVSVTGLYFLSCMAKFSQLQGYTVSVAWLYCLSYMAILSQLHGYTVSVPPCGLGIRIQPTFALVRVVRAD